MRLARSLNSRIMIFTSLIIVTTIVASGIFYLREFKKDYLEAIEWRSVTLAQSVRLHIGSRYETFGRLADLDLILDSAYLECRRLYEANRGMHVSFVSVLDAGGTIIVHNDKRLWHTRISSPQLVAALGERKIRTILLGRDYHTLVPVLAEDDTLLGVVDVGFPKTMVDQMVAGAYSHATALFFVIFAGAFLLSWHFIRRVVIHPVSELIQATGNIARGDLSQEIDVPRTEEFKNLALSLTRMRDAIRQSMAEVARKSQEVKALIACSPVALFSVDLSGAVAIWTRSAERLFGWTAGEIKGRGLPIFREADRGRFEDLGQEVCRGRVVMGMEIQQQKKDGSVFHGSLSFAPIRDADGRISGIMGTVEDISGRIEREKEHEKTRGQLLQVQKMESVGRLAGGVAHDYNNTLGVILGYAELLMDGLSPGDPRGEDLQEIIQATLHSANITRQLLAFARKQTISPKMLDLNRQVETMLKMLRRLIGENIELVWIPGNDLGVIRMDPVQVDQVLANLCINARDALDGSGKITIETRGVTVDEDYCCSHAGFRAGRFICLEVSDTGVGMDKEVLDNIFEPFFTTKGRGEGTGLGLSTVYGIVKQNKGFINVYSEPGNGATFKIYFSRYGGQADEIQGLRGTEDSLGQGEAVLLVEDEAALLKISKTILEKLGYQVFCARNPEEAVILAREHREVLRLLITDVILPDINGLELSRRLKAVCPEIKVLYMSGYTANVIAHQGILYEDVHFIQKPFSKRELSVKIREVLS